MFPNNVLISYLYLIFQMSDYRRFLEIVIQQAVLSFMTGSHRRVGILIVATIYLQVIQNRYMFRSFTVLQRSHQHCVNPVASDVEVVGYP